MKKWMLLLSLVLMIVIVNCGQAQAGNLYTGVFGHDYAQGGNAGRF